MNFFRSKAFFDTRVTHVNAMSNQNKPKSVIFKDQEVEKKRKYQQHVFDVEMGYFTPLVFGTNGGMGPECQMFLRNLAEKLCRKKRESYAIVMSWLYRTHLSFEILKSVHTIQYYKIASSNHGLVKCVRCLVK